MSDPVGHQGPAASGPASAGEPARNAGSTENVEYRVAHLHDRLAAEELGELGVRAEIRAGAIALTGTVPSAQCRESVLRIAREELAGLTVHTDIVVAETTRPDHAEEL
ncbi:BON domain-containing protein [Streptomyces sp. AC602_WCS936]|uniref:BON domain-containing protein n=1 Tax=Streptomyces sp. AC602_WCS936 TaxID=2823685 RepID=UPI0020B72F4D|nr:BON domain-containing protein [Streptomyces sp. AC602_WCS936]